MTIWDYLIVKEIGESSGRAIGTAIGTLSQGILSGPLKLILKISQYGLIVSLCAIIPVTLWGDCDGSLAKLFSNHSSVKILGIIFCLIAVVILRHSVDWCSAQWYRAQLFVVAKSYEFADRIFGKESGSVCRPLVGFGKLLTLITNISGALLFLYMLIRLFWKSKFSLNGEFIFSLALVAVLLLANLVILPLIIMLDRCLKNLTKKAIG